VHNVLHLYDLHSSGIASPGNHTFKYLHLTFVNAFLMPLMGNFLDECPLGEAFTCNQQRKDGIYCLFLRVNEKIPSIWVPLYFTLPM
jgi:hypothetical protein